MEGSVTQWHGAGRKSAYFLKRLSNNLLYSAPPLPHFQRWLGPLIHEFQEFCLINQIVWGYPWAGLRRFFYPAKSFPICSFAFQLPKCGCLCLLSCSPHPCRFVSLKKKKSLSEEVRVSAYAHSGIKMKYKCYYITLQMRKLQLIEVG